MLQDLAEPLFKPVCQHSFAPTPRARPRHQRTVQAPIQISRFGFTLNLDSLINSICDVGHCLSMFVLRGLRISALQEFCCRPDPVGYTDPAANYLFLPRFLVLP